MTVRQQWGAVALVVLLLGGALAAATHVLGPDLFPVTVGSRAPDFRAAALAGGGTAHAAGSTTAPAARTLADYRGQVVLLNLWATWCAPCEVEMPSLERLHREFGARGLHVVAVSIDDPGTEEKVRAWARERGLTFEIVHEPTGAIQKAYQTTGVPETFVIGRDGVIRKKVIGAATWDSDANRALIASLLGDAAS